MANTFLKATRIAAQALGLLEREIVLPALVWRDATGDFAGAGGDTISLRVPAKTTARTRALRGTRGTSSEGTGIITMDDLTETKVDVTLDTAVYSAVPVTDEELTLDIANFGDQVLMPQVRAVAEGVENVPMTERYAVVGADVEALLLKSDHLSRYDGSGDNTALRDALVGRIAGFNQVYVSNALPADVGFCFHRTAYVLGMRAPQVPQGASFGASQAYQDLAMRWIRDYDFRNVQDRSLVDVYLGTNIVADGPETQVVTITGAPTGGTFTLTYSGQTTSGIAYNANAATVQAALEALSNIGPGNVSASGGALPGTAVKVRFVGKFYNTNVAAMTASGASLTGGTSPAVAISAGPGGSGTSFVRAVKMHI